MLRLGPCVHLPTRSDSQAPEGLARMNKHSREELCRFSHPPSIKEEKLKFYITSRSFCLCNSAGFLKSLDHVGHVVSERGDLQY